MKKKQYTFSLELEVYDMEQLARLAQQRALEDGLSEEEWTDMKKDSEDLPGLYLQTILDPGSLSGCNIHQSDVERIEGGFDDDGFDEDEDGGEDEE